MQPHLGPLFPLHDVEFKSRHVTSCESLEESLDESVMSEVHSTDASQQPKPILNWNRDSNPTLADLDEDTGHKIKPKTASRRYLQIHCSPASPSQASCGERHPLKIWDFFCDC